MEDTEVNYYDPDIKMSLSRSIGLIACCGYLFYVFLDSGGWPPGYHYVMAVLFGLIFAGSLYFIGSVSEFFWDWFSDFHLGKE